MASHSSTLAGKIPWMEKPGRLQSMGSQRVRHDWTTELNQMSTLMFDHYRYSNIHFLLHSIPQLIPCECKRFLDFSYRVTLLSKWVFSIKLKHVYKVSVVLIFIFKGYHFNHLKNNQFISQIVFCYRNKNIWKFWINENNSLLVISHYHIQ